LSYNNDYVNFNQRFKLGWT